MSVAKFIALVAPFAAPVLAQIPVNPNEVKNSKEGVKDELKKYAAITSDRFPDGKPEDGGEACKTFLEAAWAQVITTGWKDSDETTLNDPNTLKAFVTSEAKQPGHKLQKESEEANAWKCVRDWARTMGTKYEADSKEYLTLQIKFRTLSFLYFYYVTQTLDIKGDKTFSEAITKTAIDATANKDNDPVKKAIDESIKGTVADLKVPVGSDAQKTAATLRQLLVHLIDKDTTAPVFAAAMTELKLSFFDVLNTHLAVATKAKGQTCKVLKDPESEQKDEDVSACHDALDKLIVGFTIGHFGQLQKDAKGLKLQGDVALYAVEDALGNLDVQNGINDRVFSVVTAISGHKQAEE